MSYNHIGSIIKNLIESLSDTSSAYGEVFEEVDNRMTVPGSAKYTLSLSFNDSRVRPRIYIDDVIQPAGTLSCQVLPHSTVKLAINTVSFNEPLYNFYRFSGFIIDGEQCTEPEEFNPNVAVSRNYTFQMPVHNVEVVTTWTVAGNFVRVYLPEYEGSVIEDATITIDGVPLVPEEGTTYQNVRLRTNVSLNCTIGEGSQWHFYQWNDGNISSSSRPLLYTRAMAENAPEHSSTQPMFKWKQIDVSLVQVVPTTYLMSFDADPIGSVEKIELSIGTATPETMNLPCSVRVAPGTTIGFSPVSINNSGYTFADWAYWDTTWVQLTDDEDATYTVVSSDMRFRVRCSAPQSTICLNLDTYWDQSFESITVYIVNGSTRTPYTWGAAIPEPAQGESYNFHVDIVPNEVVCDFALVPNVGSETWLRPSNPLSFDFSISETMLLTWVTDASSGTLTVTVPESGAVTYTNYEGSSVPLSGTMKVGYTPGSTTLFCSNPLSSSRIFDGWFIDGVRKSSNISYTPASSTEVPARSSIEAKYADAPVIVKYVLSKAQIVGGSITASVGGQVQALPYLVDDGSTVTLANTPAEGYTFSHYTVNDVTIEGNTFTISGANAVVGAVFNQQATFTGFTLQDGTHPTSSTTLEVPEHNAEVPVWVDTNADFTYWLTGDASMFSVTRPLNNTFLIVRDIDPSNSNGENNAVLHVQVGSTERTLKLKKVIEFQGDYKTYTSDGNTSKAVSVSASAQTLTYTLQRGELWTSPTAGSTVLYWKGPRFPVDNTLSSNQCYYASSTDVPSSSNLVTVGSISGTGEDNRMQYEFLGSPNPYLSTDGSINLLSRSFLNYSVQINIPANTSGVPKYYVAKFYYTFSEPLYFVIYQSA